MRLVAEIAGSSYVLPKDYRSFLKVKNLIRRTHSKDSEVVIRTEKGAEVDKGVVGDIFDME